MRTLRFATALALALTLAAPALLAGVRGRTYVGDFNVDGSGDCAAMTFKFNDDELSTTRVSGCNAVFNGTFKQLDLFFVGFWSLEARTSGASQPNLILSGLELYFGARIYGSGKSFGAHVSVWGVPQEVVGGGSDVARLGWNAADPMRSPERL